MRGAVRCVASGLVLAWAAGVVGACGASGASTTPPGDGGAMGDGSSRPEGGQVSDGGHRLPDGAIQCSTDGDCRVDGGYPDMSCSPGGQISGCGICESPQYPCSVDSDCLVLDDAAATQPMVCAPGGPCTCPVGGKSGNCVPACKGGDCGPDFACTSGHCVAQPCTSDSDCADTSTVDYACESGTCQHKTCTSDADCGGHYCVDQVCYPDPGVCVPPAA